MCSSPSSSSTKRAPRIGSSEKLRPGGSPLRRSVYRALTATGSEISTIGRSKPTNRTLNASPNRSRFRVHEGERPEGSRRSVCISALCGGSGGSGMVRSSHRLA